MPAETFLTAPMFKLKFNFMRYTAYFILASLMYSAVPAFSQDTISPYKTSFKVDAPVIIGGLGLSYLGFTMIQNKDPLTEAEVASLSKSDVNFLDRSIAGNYSKKANDASYIPFYASFGMPVVMLLNKNIGHHAGQVLTLYGETMAITGALYTLTAGAINRPRPLVYSSDADLGKRMSKNSQRSFYAGHTAATAAATFLTAKVFSDLNPDSRAKPYVWAAAAVIPAYVGYLRSKAGQHFITDNLVGYALGAGTGILVPHLHKRLDNTNLSIAPVRVFGEQGLMVTYDFN